MWSQIWTALKGELRLNIDAFLKKNAFEKRVLISQHQTLVGSRAVALLEVLKSLFMVLDRRLQLLDVFGPALAEGCLRLTIPLLAFL